MAAPINIVSSIDFNSENDLKKVLLRDKHTRIKGLFTEDFFYKEILEEKFEDCTTGWWFGLKEGNYFILKFTLSAVDLSAIDLELLEYFSRRNRDVFVVEFNELEKVFYYHKYESGNGRNVKSSWNKLKKLYPKPFQNPALPPISERNPERLNQAIQYLSQSRGLKRCAIERLFAGFILGNSLFWDIDYFVKYKGEWLAFEVKQKFPTAKGTWGLNVGLARLFTYIKSLNFKVVHVILVKPVNDARIPAIDLYTKEEYRKDARWIAAEFNEHLLQGDTGIAPGYTSITGASSLAYYHISPEHFRLIKEVDVPTNNIENFINGALF